MRIAAFAACVFVMCTGAAHAQGLTGSGGSSSTADVVERAIIARPATTTRRFNMDVYGSYVDGLPLQEATDFKGWTAGLDFTAPLNRTMQLRVLLPVRTEGDAVLVSNDEDIHIKGWSGIFDFATLFFEHQVIGRDGGPNRFAYFLGLGWRTGVLETGTYDRYNHQGRSVHLGVRYERRLTTLGTLLLDAEYRDYEVSDDLNPQSLHDDRFDLFRVTGAWIGPRWGVLTPALELSAQAVKSYLPVSIIPELFLHAGRAVEIKAGVPLALTSDGPDWGADLRATITF